MSAARQPIAWSTLGRIVLLYFPDSNSYRQVDPLRVERDRRFADSLLEQSGFEPSVPAGDQRGPLGSGLQTQRRVREPSVPLGGQLNEHFAAADPVGHPPPKEGAADRTDV